MELFTLTLTLSLKGEGIAELRKSYPDFLSPPRPSLDILRTVLGLGGFRLRRQGRVGGGVGLVVGVGR